MKLDIAVLGARRPRYLYVCLDALFKVRGIRDCSVYVYIDGVNAAHNRPVLRKAMEPYIDVHPITEVVFHPRCLGKLEAHTKALEETFDKGAEAVLMVEDDLILATDSLDYLHRVIVQEPSFFHNLFNSHTCGFNKGALGAWDEEGTNKGIGYNPLGVVVASQNFEQLFAQIKKKLYLQLPWGDTGMKIGDLVEHGIERQTHDSIFDALAKINKWELVSPVKTRVGHFGVRNSPHVCISKVGLSDLQTLSKDRVALEAEFFVGPRETWLDNVCSIFRSDRLSKMEYAAMTPLYWEYQ